MCKRFFIILFSISIILADQVEHDYNSAIPTFTKTPHPGRMSFFMNFGNSSYNNEYVGTKNTSLMNKYDISGVMVDAKYHGVNGVGISGSQRIEEFSYDSGDNPSRISTTLGIYMVWNEIYPESSPSMLDGHQFTFPTTKILTSLNFMRIKDTDNTYSSAVYLTTAMDLIISKSLILTNLLRLDIQDRDDIFWTSLSSKLVYDLDNKVSFAPSIVHAQNNSGDYETFILVEGSYQFRNLNYGYLDTDAKISPYLKFNVAGQDVVYSNKEVGVNLYFFFN